MMKTLTRFQTFVAGCLLLFTAHEALAHRAPSNCGGSGVGVQVFKFRLDGTVANTITNGESVVYTVQIQNDAQLPTPSGNVPVCDVTCASVILHCPDMLGNVGASIVVATNVNVPFGTPPFTAGSVTCIVSVASGTTIFRARAEVQGVVHDLSIAGCTPVATCVTNACDPDVGGGQQEVSVTVRSPCINVTKQCLSAVNIGGNAIVITFSGTVSNCSDEPLANVSVVNNQPTAGTLVTNISSLAPGQSVSFGGIYTNTSNSCGPFLDTVTATGTGIGSLDTARDSASATCTIAYTPCIRVTKICNPASPANVQAGESINFSGVVTNCGNSTLTNVILTDTFLGGVIATIPRLEAGGFPGSSASYSTNYVTTQQDCTRGIITNTVIASGIDFCNPAVTVHDTNNCTFVVVGEPRIQVYKQLVCVDANGTNCLPFNSDLTTQKSAIGVSTVDALGQEHCPAFCYRITIVNTSAAGIELRSLVVTDNNFPGGGVDLTGCFPTTLGVPGSPNSSASCIIPAATICDNTTNIVTATAVGIVASTGDLLGNVSGRDTNNVVIVPFNITCEKEASTNGTTWSSSIDLTYGTTNQVFYRVTVSNSSSLPLVVTINDGTFGCPAITVPLAANSSVTTNLCTIPVVCPPDTNNVVNISAIVNTALTNGVCVYTAAGREVTDTTTCEAPVRCVPPPKTGCSPGFWKNCTIHWQLTGYTTGQSVSSVFSLGNCCTNLGNSSLLSALSFRGGSEVCGGARILLRAAVAALLNASSLEVDYPFTAQEVIMMVNAALQSCDRGTMLVLAGELDRDNNLGCRDANGNGLPCHRLPAVLRPPPTKVTGDARFAPSRQ